MSLVVAVVVLGLGVVCVTPASAAAVPMWPAASEVALPANATTASGQQNNAVIAGVSCTSAGNCAAGGHYRDMSGSFHALVASETNGSWGRTSELALPANATATSGQQYAAVAGVS